MINDRCSMTALHLAPYKTTDILAPTSLLHTQTNLLFSMHFLTSKTHLSISSLPSPLKTEGPHFYPLWIVLKIRCRQSASLLNNEGNRENDLQLFIRGDQIRGQTDFTRLHSHSPAVPPGLSEYYPGEEKLKGYCNYIRTL